MKGLRLSFGISCISNPYKSFKKVSSNNTITSYSFLHSTSRSIESIQRFRKLLPALIKHIHPDLFGSYPLEVQQRNLQCTQTLNEYWNALGHLYNDFSVKGNSSLNISPPLSSSYSISCFIKSPGLIRLFFVDYYINFF